MLGIFVYDAKYRLIPDSMLVATAILAVVMQVDNWWLGQFNIWGLVWGIIAGSGLFYLIYTYSKGKWLGFGDVKLGLLIGFVLAWPKILVALWLGFVLGGLIGAILMITGNKKPTSQIAFGPFLIIGFWLSLIYGDIFLEWIEIFLMV